MRASCVKILFYPKPNGRDNNRHNQRQGENEGKKI